MNPPMREWFEGYEKACSDIKRAVVDAAFKGRPLPEHWRPNEKRGLTTIITRTTDHGKAEDAFNAE